MKCRCTAQTTCGSTIIHEHVYDHWSHSKECVYVNSICDIFSSLFHSSFHAGCFDWYCISKRHIIISEVWYTIILFKLPLLVFHIDIATYLHSKGIYVLYTNIQYPMYTNVPDFPLTLTDGLLALNGWFASDRGDVFRQLGISNLKSWIFRILTINSRYQSE